MRHEARALGSQSSEIQAVGGRQGTCRKTGFRVVIGAGCGLIAQGQRVGNQGREVPFAKALAETLAEVQFMVAEAPKYIAKLAEPDAPEPPVQVRTKSLTLSAIPPDRTMAGVPALVEQTNGPPWAESGKAARRIRVDEAQPLQRGGFGRDLEQSRDGHENSNYRSESHSFFSQIEAISTNH
jgi:hypothetical protein